MRRKKTTSEFLHRAKEIHGDKYDYSKVKYEYLLNKVCIICPEHGEFWQRPSDHISKQGNGCPKCAIKEKSKRVLDRKFKDLIQPEDHKLIPLTKGKYAMVDNEDFDRVKDINWSLKNSGYYGKTYASNTLYGGIHNFIMRTPKGMCTDHINGDTLDNRKSNLRVCTTQQNNMNQRIQCRKNKTSKYKGVSLCKVTYKSWIAQVYINRKRIYLGRFKSEEEAALAYNKKSSELFGEYANLNIIAT